jgi:hypothetical protein
LTTLRPLRREGRGAGGMCGIFAILGLTAVAPHTYRPRAVELSKRIRHRGPDAEHCYTDDAGNYLCHQRLAIMDPNAASEQPLFLNKGTPDELCWITNGEIYNHLALKEELGLQAALSDSWVQPEFPPIGRGEFRNRAVRARLLVVSTKRARPRCVCGAAGTTRRSSLIGEAPHGPSMPNDSPRWMGAAGVWPAVRQVWPGGGDAREDGRHVRAGGASAARQCSATAPFSLRTARTWVAR